ncbi:cupin domain-containing protein [Hyalangium sp.]|uniref:cupin domain-containing protein n=1 Tax=Hyalangium sp. TaxID=2028555 RepID=UPI002D2B7CFF|nr:cupin domain-containing protein [Hyalangium sp.]HYH99370.1 cupin domain-containing protein [Hyalangium sp.]
MKINIQKAPTRLGSGYPAPFDKPCLDRKRVRLGAAAGLTQFGVNLLHLQPGTWSSQRHWHMREDEFIYVVSGEVVLVTDEGEEVLRAGDCAGFPHGAPNGHHLQNRSTREAIILEAGTDDPQDKAEYPDIDLRATPDGYEHKDGTPYPKAGQT